MEKKKNNALEKAEKAQVDSSNKKEQRVKEKNEKNAIREQRLAEKKREQAQKRVEMAKLKAHKKAEREKAKATLLREKNRRKAEKREKRELLKRERMERKQALKKENKEEKQRRLQLERQAKLDKMAERKKERAERRRQVLAEKKQRREQRQNAKQKNKGYGGWLATVISLGVATLVLASVLTFTFLTPSTNDNMLNYSYQRSFYDAIEQVDNIDLNLSKALATKDKGAMQRYLVDTAINSELAESDIQSLPLHDESKYYTAKLINQIGDYAKYLNNKLIDGEPLTEQDRKGLVQLYQANLALKNALQEVTSEMDGDYSFMNLDKAKGGDILLDTLGELENLSVQYPELIYDGPFSDGILDRKVKGVSGNAISFENAKEIFAKTFNDYSFSSILDAGETHASIECYNVQGETDGDILFAQISKIGGHLVMFAYAGSCESTVISEQTAIDNALDFIEKLQIKNMQEVWLNLANNVYTINFVGTQNGTVIYPDMIKVRVCAETGKVIGFEATEYYTNHTARSISAPSLSKKEAKQKLIEGFKVKATRKALVPIGTESEKLCYEFYGEVDNQTYYVYIDANSGRQVQMFKVVEGTEGKFLM